MVARPYHLLLSVIPEEDIGGNNEGGSAGRLRSPFVPNSSVQIGDHQGKMDTLRRIHLVSSLLLKVFLLLSVCLLLMAALSVLLPWLMAADDEVESSKSAPLPNKRQRIYSGQERPPDEEHRLLNEFLAFEENYSRSFASDEERLWRYLLFVRNMRSLEQRIATEAQKAGGTVTEWGVTEFFDWSDEELAKLVMPPLKGQGSDHDRWWHDVVQKAESSGYVRPKQWDWRDKGVVTHVKSQQRCGACWAFAVTATVESLHAIRNGTLVILSEQQLIDCDQSNNGCEGGYRPNAFRYIRDNGQLMETAYPYRGVDGNCKLPPGPIDPSQRVFVDQLRSLTSDEEQIADWVAQKGPVTFGMTVTKSMFQYRGGVFAPSPEECAREAVGSHAMEVIGFGETGGQMATPYWIMKNSWGSGWGVNGGYMLMRRGVNSCGLAREVYTALIN